jgi:glycosyltransferase involved in cell wall biosynthesis
MLRDLCHEHEFTVFAVEFENPCPERIHSVRIPVPTRPLALLFLAYHLCAPLCYWVYRLRQRVRFHVVLVVESNLSFGNLSYAHFCHRAYLKYHWRQTKIRGVRGALRWLDHWLRALCERWVYRWVQHIVVPSWGLKRDLEAEYPFTQGKIHCIPNPVDIERMRLPAGFDREEVRRSFGLHPEDVALVFVALGHFERKGMPALLQALTQLDEPRLKLVVVGGEPDLVAAYQARGKRMGLDEQVIFIGMQRDVRPYLWGADGFILPSLYETFSLVSLEAAAAGLPLILTSVYGVEEFIQDGKNGVLVDPTVEGVVQGLSRFLALPPQARRVMGDRAQRDTARYTLEHFVAAWRTFFYGWDTTVTRSAFRYQQRRGAQ